MKCFECGGLVVQDKSSFVLYAHDKSPVFFEDVPVGACSQCGERYLSGAITEKLSGILESGHVQSDTHMSVPVVHLTA